MARYLITGGAGFIGSHIANHLLNLGEEVTILDIRKPNGKFKGAKILTGSITDLEFIKKAARDMDFILHQAAVPSVPRSIKDPYLTNSANVDGTLNVLIAAKEAGAKRVVFASSSSVYGDSPYQEKKETHEPGPKSPYAVSKLAGEYYCKVFYELFGLETVILRYFNVFGPGQDPNSEYSAVIPKFITSILRGERPIIYGDGTQSRDFTYVDNVVLANMLACDTSNKKAPGQAFNIAMGGSISLNDLAAMIGDALENKLAPIHKEPRAGDIMHSKADISKAKKDLGYKPEIDAREGIKKTAEWFKNAG